MNFNENYKQKEEILEILHSIKNIILLKTNYFLEDDETLKLWIKEWIDSKKTGNSLNYKNIICLIKIIKKDNKAISNFIDFYKQKKSEKVTKDAIGKSIKINNIIKTITDINIQKDKDKIDIHFQDNQMISIKNITELEKVLIANKKIYQKGVGSV